MHSGADLIKTSTGKVQPAATMPVTLANDVVMQIAKLADGRYQGPDYFPLP